MKLPDSFPAGTEFFDVEGVPVTKSPEYVVRAWDTDPPRRFSAASMSRNGTLVHESDFRKLAAASQAAA